MITTNTGHILIYKSSQLVWTVKLGFIPIYLDIVSFGKVNGLILTLADNGWT